MRQFTLRFRVALHDEYYQMFAALNDFHEACISVYTPQQADRRDGILSSIVEIEDRVRAATPDWKTQLASWADARAAEQPARVALRPITVPFEDQKFRILEDGSILSESYAPTFASNDFSLTTQVGTIGCVSLVGWFPKTHRPLRE